MQPENLDAWHVRNARGEMVPFSAFASSHWTFGSPRLERFNGLSAIEIQGEAAAGVSSGVAMAEIDRLMLELPEGFTPRSEENTTELQCLMRNSYPVFCLTQ